MAVFDGGAQTHVRTSGNYVQYLGAFASLAIIAGIGVWSYDLIKRDVSGIPVVRAAQGEMRVLPENPGGEVAIHTGLAVNSVAAEGEAAELGDRLVLAPATTDLAQEDLELNPSAEAGEVLPLDLAQAQEVPVVATPDDPTEAAIAEAMTTDDILRLADQIALGVPPIDKVEKDNVVPPVLAVEGAPVVDIIPTSIPGVTTSLRPVVRPTNDVVQAVASAAAATVPAASSATVATQDQVIPAGTNLVQLGAFPSADDAATAWTALQAKFGDYMVDKDRLIQTADSGGNTFFRLRAMGFNDLSDARRFCAALEAGDVDCIPVVVR